MPQLPDFTRHSAEDYLRPEAKSALLASAALRLAASEYGTLLPATNRQLVPSSHEYIHAHTDEVRTETERLENIATEQTIILIDALHQLYQDHKPFADTPFTTILQRSYDIAFQFSLLPKEGEADESPRSGSDRFYEMDALKAIMLCPQDWIRPNDPGKRFEYTEHAHETFQAAYSLEHGCPAHRVQIVTPDGRQASLFRLAWEEYSALWLQQEEIHNKVEM